MAKAKLCLAVILLSLSVLCVGLALATRDPELKQCKHQCKVQRQFDQDQKERCTEECDDYYRQKKQRERESRKKREERQGDDDDDEWDVMIDPEMRLGQCQSQCERQQGGQQRELCGLRCKQRYERKHGGGEEEEEEEEKEGGGDANPYVFEDEHFSTKVETEHGRIDVLQRFTKKSKLLLAIENYRLSILEADPQTFVAPNHRDADGVLFVAKGRGTVTMIHKDDRESFNIECGDVIRVRAGTPVNFLNRDENEKLFIVKFLRPVNLPGKYEVFCPSGGEDGSSSFYEAFSSELLEAALKTERRWLDRVLKQKQGAIVKASKEQIEAMSRREEGGGTIWPFGTETNRPFNLLKNPAESNKYGQLFEVDHKDFKQQLQDLDITLSFANITRGSMIGPSYNSKSTKVAFVVDGEGYFEMACPHVSRSQRTGKKYEKVRSRLRRGMVFIVPAGHPEASVASRNNNLQILCFEVNAEGNTRYPLAGKNNVINKMEKEAKELAFGTSAKEVDQAFGRQNEEWFFPGPRSSRDGRADA